MRTSSNKSTKSKSRAAANASVSSSAKGGFTDKRVNTLLLKQMRSVRGAIQAAGYFVGSSGAIHLHLGIRAPHLKLGGHGDRIDIRAGDIDGMYSR